MPKLLILAFCIATAVCNAAFAGTIRSQDFENFADPLTEWSDQTTTVSPGTALKPPDRFLGQFGSGTVALSLTGLGSHSTLTLMLDLYIIRSWDGSFSANHHGPDIWSLSVVGGPTLLHSSFSNDHPATAFAGQSYPDPYPGGGPYAPKTGAIASNTLGFVFTTRDLGVVDSTYRLVFTIPHVDDSIAFEFSASNLTPPLEDESWGLDNVSVSVVVPEPQSVVLWVMGLAIILGRTKCSTGRAGH